MAWRNNSVLGCPLCYLRFRECPAVVNTPLTLNSSLFLLKIKKVHLLIHRPSTCSHPCIKLTAYWPEKVHPRAHSCGFPSSILKRQTGPRKMAKKFVGRASNLSITVATLCPPRLKRLEEMYEGVARYRRRRNCPLLYMRWKKEERRGENRP